MFKGHSRSVGVSVGIYLPGLWLIARMYSRGSRELGWSVSGFWAGVLVILRPIFLSSPEGVEGLWMSLLDVLAGRLVCVGPSYFVLAYGSSVLRRFSF